MLYIHTGRNRLLFSALAAGLRESTAPRCIVVVPRQLTLLTERMLLSELKLSGSFDLQVYGLERLCDRIFDAAGTPDGLRVDERGRAILVHTAVDRVADRLTIYAGGNRRRGFVARAARQLEVLRQAGLAPDALRACADECTGTSQLKLRDLALIHESYEQLIDGRFMDEEQQLAEAGARAASASFLKDAELFFYGFDIMPPARQRLITAVSAACTDAHIYLPLENDEESRDRACFLPMRSALSRLLGLAGLASLPVQRKLAEPDDIPMPDQAPGVYALERELFAEDPVKHAEDTPSVFLKEFPDVRAECRGTAAAVRDLVRTRGWRYSDIVVLCPDVAGYAAALRSAFKAYEVPVVLSEQRSASRHPAAECLLTALQAVRCGYAAEDMLALIATGMTGLTETQADYLTNYAIRNGLRGSRWTNELRAFTDERRQTERDRVEPLRRHVADPLRRMADRLKRAKDLPDQLEALYNYLRDISAYKHLRSHISALTRADQWELAGEESQVWNRIIGTLDQLAALTDGKKLDPDDLSMMLEEALSMSVIRMLPQSGDAVYVQSTGTVCRIPCKALFLIGMADHSGTESNTLLTTQQRDRLARFTQTYLGPSDMDVALQNRFYLKCSLGSVTSAVYISCPLTAPDGNSQKCSVLFDQARALIPGLTVQAGVGRASGVEVDIEERRRLLASPEAAADGAANALTDITDGREADPEDLAALACLVRRAQEKDPRAEQALERLIHSLDRGESADRLRPDIARALYSQLQTISISQLETFARCPFRYFAKYGLKPTDVDPFELTFADEGTFLHECAERFLTQTRDTLHLLEESEAEQCMSAIADSVLETYAETTALGDSVLSRQEGTRLKAIACFGAIAMTLQMRGSSFRNTHTEERFGREGKRLGLTDDCSLIGTIDRVDMWQDYLRVIDYKRSAHTFDPTQFYHGLQLQLLLYLAGAQALHEKDSAGVYYFTFQSDIIGNDSTDPAEIRKERDKLLRLTGLFPGDEEVAAALTPDPARYYGLASKQTEKTKPNERAYTKDEYAILTAHSEKRAAEHISAIRSGSCAVAPARTKELDPCAYCDLRRKECMRSSTDTTGVRRLKEMKLPEVLARIITEENDSAPTEETES